MKNLKSKTRAKARTSKSEIQKKYISKYSNAARFLSSADKKRTISMVMLGICFILVIFISSFSAILYNRNFYNSEYEKNNVYAFYGKNLTWAVTENLFAFFRNKEEIGRQIDNNAKFGLNSSFFNYDEKSHMHDVKNRIRTTFIVYYIAIILTVVFFALLYFNSFDFLRDLGEVFVIAGIVVIFVSIVLYFADFRELFGLFHRVFFAGNYTFPSTSNLIRMFPLKFFGDFAYRIFFFSFIKSVIFLITGIILLITSSKK